MINFQLYFISMYLKIIINAECLQYLPEITQHPDKKTKKQNMVIKLTKSFLVLASNLKKQHT